MFSKKSIYFLATIIFIALFLFFSYLVKRRLLVQFDYSITVHIQNFIPRSFDTFLSLFSLLGSIEFITLFLFIFLLLQKNIRYFLTFIFFLTAHAIEVFGKTLLSHPGPPSNFFRYNLGFLFPSAYVQTDSSYPSGHSFRAVFVALIVCYFLLLKHHKLQKKRIFFSILAVAFTIIMLISRVSLGEHWTTDVIGGSLLGLAFGYLSILMLQFKL